MVKFICYLISKKGEMLLKKFRGIFTAFILINIILLLASCTQTEKFYKKQNIESIITTFEHPETKQKYKIVNAYKLYDNYKDKVEGNPEQSKLEIYKEEVINPIYSDCFANAEYLYMADQVLNAAPDRFEEIEKINEKIDSKNTEKIIREALFKSSNLIPSQKVTTICVLPSTNENTSLLTVGANKILVQYHESFTDDYLRIGIAHEYHHSIWAEKYQSRDKAITVLDNLAFEGKAVMFANLVYPDIHLPLFDLSLTYNKEDWSKIEGDLDSEDINRSSEILFGGNELPINYGYSEGYKMVKSYLDLHPNITPKEWIALSAKEIFEKGNYIKHYQ